MSACSARVGLDDGLQTTRVCALRRLPSGTLPGRGGESIGRSLWASAAPVARARPMAVSANDIAVRRYVILNPPLSVAALRETEPRAQPAEHVGRPIRLPTELDGRRDVGLVGAGEVEVAALSAEAYAAAGRHQRHARQAGGNRPRRVPERQAAAAPAAWLPAGGAGTEATAGAASNAACVVIAPLVEKRKSKRAARPQ